ncbi:potassium channel protein [Candidatus Sumerlaeota bacterium]|nr:potassium channel protein [Candidatus Sumerlaeota bacterium]
MGSVFRFQKARWRFALGWMTLVVLFGVTGYMTLAHMSLLEALYMTVITLTTIGFHDVAYDKTGGDPTVMAFTVLLAVFGVGTLAFAFSLFTGSLIEGELRDYIGFHRARRRVYRMKDHYIVCGYGRMGEIIAESLNRENIPMIVVESDLQRRAEIEEKGLTLIVGDATHDEILKEAAIQKARALIAVTGTDPDNLFVTLSARQLNPDLLIVSRALSAEAEAKLLRAGANRVILPYKLGAHQLAQAALRPNVVDFIEIATRTTKLDIEIEEVHVAPASVLVGKTLRQATLLRDLGLIVIGIRRGSDHRMEFNPSAETTIDANDILIVLGKGEKLAEMHTHLA